MACSHDRSKRCSHDRSKRVLPPWSLVVQPDPAYFDETKDRKRDEWENIASGTNRSWVSILSIPSAFCMNGSVDQTGGKRVHPRDENVKQRVGLSAWSKQEQKKRVLVHNIRFTLISACLSSRSSFSFTFWRTKEREGKRRVRAEPQPKNFIQRSMRSFAKVHASGIIPCWCFCCQTV